MKKAFGLGLAAIMGVMVVSPAQAGFQFTAPVNTAPVPQSQALPPIAQEQQLTPMVEDMAAMPEPMALTPTAPVQAQPMQTDPMIPTPPQMDMQAAETPTSIMPQDQMGQGMQAMPDDRTAGTAPIAVQNPTGIMSLFPSQETEQQQQNAPRRSPFPPLTPTASATAPQPAMMDAGGQDYAMAVGFGRDLPLVSALGQIIPDEYTYVLDRSVPSGQRVSWSGGQPWPQVLSQTLQPLGLQYAVNGRIVTIMGQGMASSAAPMQTAAISPNIMPQASVMSDADAIMPLPPLPEQSVQPVVQPMGQQSVSAQKPQVTLMPQPQQQIAARAPKNLLRVESDDLQARAMAAPKTDDSPSIVPEESQGQWTAARGDSLKTVLMAWSDLAGVDLHWQADYDYPLQGDVNISGNFETATETLLAGFTQAAPRPVGRLHPNLPHGPAVLVVETNAGAQ